MLKDIVEAKVVAGHRLFLKFEDGVAGEVDLSEMIEFRGVFAPLRDPEEFKKVEVDRELGTVCWPNGADLDPDVLYARITGKPIDFEERASAA